METKKKRPTIDEIIKGLDNLLYYHDEKGVHEFLRGVIALIQDQKAEIERLKIDLENEKNWGKIQTKQAVKDTAKEIGIIAIQLSGMCASVYEFQNRLVDLIEVNYAVEVERNTIIPANGVEVE